jgi:exonuclease SbcC
MILSRFFKPKWQHPDPEVRKQHILMLPVSDPLLAEIVQQDKEPEVRCAAVTRITELGLLQGIAARDPAVRVRECAADRLQELLAGKVADSLTLELCCKILSSLGSRHLEYLLLHAREPAIRLAVLKQVFEEALLSEVVVNDPVAEIRFAALEQIREPQTLEQLVKLARNRDKRIYRRARERLEASRIEKKRSERIEYLCQEMESLSWDGENGLHAARFPRLEKEWQGLESTAGIDLRQRYQQARERFLGQRQESMGRRLAIRELCASLEKFLEHLQSEGELSDELKFRIERTLESANYDWHQLVTANVSEGNRLEQHFSRLHQAIRERERVLQRSHERAERLREVLQQAQILLTQPSEILGSELKALKQRWLSLERPEIKTLAQQMQVQFEEAWSKLHGRLQQQEERREQELAEIQDSVALLEEALERGELQNAIDLHEQARERLQHNISLSRKQMLNLEARLQACVPRLGELRGWRRWGTDRVREQLCEEAEKLLSSPPQPEEIAQRIRELRADWKRLDKAEGNVASRGLWRRFDKACEQAYEPCQAHFDAQAKERQNNLMRKQALCERLEHFESTVDWDQVDWASADRLQREVQNQWHKIGSVPKAQKRAIERRYSQALRLMDERLQPERDRELRRRKALIQSVQAMAAGDDLRAAMEAAKKAQAAWHPTVQASQHEEQALWRKFRVACDAVFERRKVEQQTADQERQDNLARKTALCEEIEALTEVDDKALSRACQRIREIREEWTAIGLVPKVHYRTIERRFATACRRFALHEDELRKARFRDELQGMQQRALLCAQLETLLDGQDPVRAQRGVEQARREWETLGHLPSSVWEAEITRRFDRICQVLLEGGEIREALLQELRANLIKKQILCLRVEILAGVESPDEFAQAKMEYQVARLSDSLQGRNVESVDETRDIQLEWYCQGVLPAEQNELLEARFQRAVHALERH